MTLYCEAQFANFQYEYEPEATATVLVPVAVVSVSLQNSCNGPYNETVPRRPCSRCGLWGIQKEPSMDMEKLVSLCKRRGFIFPSSEIYGGLNGFWDYGPLGVELKRNIKEAWWHNVVTGHDDLSTVPGAPAPYEMVGL